MLGLWAGGPHERKLPQYVFFKPAVVVDGGSSSTRQVVSPISVPKLGSCPEFKPSKPLISQKFVEEESRIIKFVNSTLKNAAGSGCVATSRPRVVQKEQKGKTSFENFSMDALQVSVPFDLLFEVNFGEVDTKIDVDSSSEVRQCLKRWRLFCRSPGR